MRLVKRTILISLLVISMIGAIAGGGLFAHFQDTETSAESSFTAGTIDLAVNGQNPWQESSSWEAKPCDWVLIQEDSVSNVGENDGLLTYHIGVTLWGGGEHPEPEWVPDPNNNCDLPPNLELIVVETDTCGLPLEAIVEGLADYRLAAQALEDYLSGQGVSYTMWAGLFAEYDCDSKAMGLLPAGQSRCVYFLVHIFQPADANKMQGDLVVFDKTFRLDQIPCDGDVGGGKEILLPDYPIQATITYNGGTPSYWTVDLAGIGAELPYNVTNGTYLGWCIDEKHQIYSGRTWTVEMVSSLNPAIYGYDPDWGGWGYNPAVPNVFNYVNYLINTYDAAHGGESSLQQAIWYFINNHDYDDLNAAAQGMVDDALLNGGDYVPGEGELAAVVLFQAGPPPYGGAYSVMQLTFIEVDP
jgi:hypothetical protein